MIMHLGFIFKKAAGNISSRKFNFVLTLVVMLVTLYLTFDVAGMYFKSNYYIYKTEQAFADYEKTADGIRVQIPACSVVSIRLKK